MIIVQSVLVRKYCYKKGDKCHDKSNSREKQCIEKLVLLGIELVVDEVDPSHIENYLDKGSHKEYLPMNTIENYEKEKIDEGEEEHIFCTGWYLLEPKYRYFSGESKREKEKKVLTKYKIKSNILWSVVQ